MAFQLNDNGTVSAPLTGAEVKQMAQDGLIFEDMKIRKLPDGPWQSAAAIKGVALAERPLSSPPAAETLGYPQLQPQSPPEVRKVATPQAPRPRPVPMQAPATRPEAVPVQNSLVPTATLHPVAEAIVEDAALEVVDVEYVKSAAPLVECPFCSEDIKATAKKCKHCGEILDVMLRDAQRASMQQATPQPVAAATPAVVVHNNNHHVVANRTYVNHAQPSFSPFVAAFLSFLIAGLGQLYKGQVVNGIVWFIVVYIGYMAFILPGFVLHLCCIVGAASGHSRGSRGW